MYWVVAVKQASTENARPESAQRQQRCYSGTSDAGTGAQNQDMLCTRQAERTVRATRTGTLILRKVEPADVVRLSRTLMWLSPGRETQFVVTIHEKKLHEANRHERLVSVDV